MAKAKKAVPATVNEFLRTLKHPLKPEVEALRKLILGADRKIGEGIKWNAPSFLAGEYFATVNLRATDSVQVILHLGAKVRDTATKGMQIDDPQDLLKWLAKDRCMVTLKDMKDLKARGGALQAIVRQWIRYL
jgi:hypothetical protein